MIAREDNYARAYTEFSCLIKYLPQSYVSKLPKKFIDFLQEEYDKRFEISIDVNKRLLEQNFSEKTKDLISVIKYNYWSTNEEKQKLNKAFYENEEKHQKELMETFNPDEMFNKNKSNVQNESSSNIADYKENNLTYNLEKKNNETQIIKYKESFFTKIINRTKNFLIGKR